MGNVNKFMLQVTLLPNGSVDWEELIVFLSRHCNINPPFYGTRHSIFLSWRGIPLPFSAWPCELTLFGSGFARSIDSDFDRFRVGCHLGHGKRLNADGDREGFTTATTSNKSQIVEFGYLVLHYGRVISHFSAVVFVVAGFHCNNCAVRDVVEGDHFEGARQALIATPMIGQRWAENGWWLGLDQFPVVLLEHLVDIGKHIINCRRHRRTLALIIW